MKDELRLLREFRADVPSPTDETRRRIHSYAVKSEHSRPPRRLLRRRGVLVPLALAGAVLAASLSAALAWTGGTSSTTQNRDGAGAVGNALPSATMAQPLLGGRKISLSDASGALGAPITFPSASLVQSSELGPVWVLGKSPTVTVAVTAPSRGLIFEYMRPAPTDPTATYQGVAQETPDIFQFSNVSGVPALIAKASSDATGNHFGSVAFVTGSTQIRVMGDYDTATLVSLAQSILAQPRS